LFSMRKGSIPSIEKKNFFWGSEIWLWIWCQMILKNC
jgi:hypothetical protein